MLDNAILSSLLRPLVSSVAPPQPMPNPMNNTPHPLAIQAATLLQHELTHTYAALRDFFAPGAGKMFGVLVVRDAQENLGFISAFSGMMNGKWNIDGFVPPVFDLQAQQSFLPTGQQALQAMDTALQRLLQSKQSQALQQRMDKLNQQREQALQHMSATHQIAKAKRRQQRQHLSSLPAEQHAQTMAALALASQHDKRERINAKQLWLAKIEAAQQQLDTCEQHIHNKKMQRAELSRQLQQRVFAGYQLHNFLGEHKALTACFGAQQPPAGAGDCAAPKLLHFAQQHRLHPLALAEFWWGASHPADIRHHGHFYAACSGKCRPILPFMLQGISLEPEPVYGLNIDPHLPDIVYEDDDILVVNKPAGLLSAPGKSVRDSVLTRMGQRYPQCPDLRLVHRLDMGTSGLLMLAKTQAANKHLQRQFIQHQVEKHYVALLSKPLNVDATQGEIDLPMRLDWDNKPRQMVCAKHGKPASTHWELLGNEGDVARVCFSPHSGRTHQLRVHAAHPHGLNAPIVGDGLYGQDGQRLMLHAQSLVFTHPRNFTRIHLTTATPF